MQTPPQFHPRDFRKATYSSESGNNCVLVARRGPWVELRDSKTQFDAEDDVRFVFTADQFDAFLDGFRGDHRTGLCMEIVVTDDGVHMLRSTVPQRQGTTMRFSDTELLAFYDGIQNGEFRQEAFQH